MIGIGTNRKVSLILFLALFASFLAIIACQPNQQTSIIGVVSQTSGLAELLEGFKAGMADLGYLEGNNVEYLYAGPTDFEGLAQESQRLLAENVDLILALGTPAALEAQQAVRAKGVPVVFAPVYDPVKSGLVRSLLQPGGNLTGVRSGGRIAKVLELHLDIAPDTKSIFAPHNPAYVASIQSLAELNHDASALGINVNVAEVSTSDELTAALHDLPEDTDALFLLTSGFLIRNVDEFVDAAIRNRIPISSASSSATNGLLLAYQSDQHGIGWQASRLADKILLGTSPSVLPVETADPILSINLETGRKSGSEFQTTSCIWRGW